MALVRIGNSLVDAATIHSILWSKSRFKVIFKDKSDPYDVPDDEIQAWGEYLTTFPTPAIVSLPASVQGEAAPPAVKADEGE